MKHRKQRSGQGYGRQGGNTRGRQDDYTFQQQRFENEGGQRGLSRQDSQRHFTQYPSGYGYGQGTMRGTPYQGAPNYSSGNTPYGSTPYMSGGYEQGEYTPGRQGYESGTTYGRSEYDGYEGGGRYRGAEFEGGGMYGRDYGRERDYLQGQFRGQAGNYGQGMYAQGGYGQGTYTQDAGYRGGESGWSSERGSYGEYGNRDSFGGSSSRSSGLSGYGSGGSATMDDRSSHRQRGSAPKNYKRSDERITDDVIDCLMEEGIDGTNIEVQVKDGVVTLTGEVGDRADKHRIEELAAECWGVKDVENQLRLSKEGDSGSQSKWATGTSPASSATSGIGSATMAGAGQTTGYGSSSKKS